MRAVAILGIRRGRNTGSLYSFERYVPKCLYTDVKVFRAATKLVRTRASRSLSSSPAGSSAATWNRREGLLPAHVRAGYAQMGPLCLSGAGDTLNRLSSAR